MLNDLITEEEAPLKDLYIDMSFFNETLCTPLTPDNSILKLNLNPSLEEPNKSYRIPKGSTVWVRFEGRRPNGELLDKSTMRFQKKKLRLFYDDLIPGLHIAISSMKKGETSWFKLAGEQHYFSTFQYAPQTKTPFTPINPLGLTSNEALYYKVQLLDYKLGEKALLKMDFKGRLSKFESSRVLGNSLFHTGLYDKAFRAYRASIELLLKFPRDLKGQLSKEELEKLDYYASILYGNGALCKIRLQKWYEGISLLLEGEKHFLLEQKVRLRKGFCYYKAGEFKKAKEVCELLIKEGFEAAEELLKDVIKGEENEGVIEKRMFKGIFDKWEKEEKEEAWGRKKRKMEILKENSLFTKDYKGGLMKKLKEGVILDMNDPKNPFLAEEEELEE